LLLLIKNKTLGLLQVGHLNHSAAADNDH